MARFYGLDIVNYLDTTLTSELNTMITTINGERSLTGEQETPAVRNITAGPGQQNFPECYIDITGSAIDFADGELNQAIDRIPEVYTAEVVIQTRDSSRYNADFAEVYVEALERVLHKPQGTSDICYIMVTDTVRGDVQTRQGYSDKIVGVQIEISIRV